MALIFPLASALPAIQTDRSAEERIINHLMKNAEPGKPFIFSHLYNNVFTSPEERKALDRLFNVFFQIPSFIAQHKASTDKIPTLAEIERRFSLWIPGEVQLLLTIMENDPRIPAFIKWDKKSGEIVSVDIDEIRKDRRFGEAIERSIVGWTGKKAPSFNLDLAGVDEISAAALLGRSYLIYFWFSSCPPCVKTSPHLAKLYEDYGGDNFTILAVNADRFLELGTSDQQLIDYVGEQGYPFPVAHLDKEMNDSYGHIGVYPTFFLVDRDGIIRNHRIGYQEPQVLAADIENLLKEYRNDGKGKL